MDGESNVGAGSTTWTWKRVKIRRPAGGQKPAPRKGHRWKRFGQRDPMQWLTIRVKYSGGAEGWVVIDGRGEKNAYPGYTALIDLVGDINQSW